MTFLHITHYDKLLLLCQSFFSKNKSTDFVYEQWISYKKTAFFLVEMKVIKNPEHFDTKTNEIVQHLMTRRKHYRSMLYCKILLLKNNE